MDNKVIDATVKTTELIDIVKAKDFDLNVDVLKRYNAQIIEKIARLDIDNMVASEDNLSTLTSTRADINREIKEFETKRKHAENMAMKPIKEFKKAYKKYIFDELDTASKVVDKKVKDVTDVILERKTKVYVDKFNALKEANGFDFLDFKDVGLNITRSASDVKLLGELTGFFDKIKADLQVININDNVERIKVEYYKTLDLAGAVTTVTNAIELENKLKEQAQLAKEAQEAPKEAPSEPVVDNTATNIPEAKSSPKDVKSDITITLTVTASRDKLIALRQFLNEGGFHFE